MHCATAMSAMDTHGDTAAAPWEAELRLGFVRSGDKTVLARRAHRGPLTVQRPFYPEGGLCHVYLLHPPGGIVAGDRLHIAVEAERDAEALLTTPAAGKFYRSSGLQARQDVALTLAGGSVLEWLPQETIVFQGAKLASSVDIALAADARFIGWEILALGRPAAGEEFADGEARLSWRIVRDGKPLYLETMRLNADAYRAAWGLRQHAACGTLFAYPATADQRDAVRRIIGEAPNRGVTLIDQLLVCRALDRNTETLRRFFEAVRAAIRGAIVRRENCSPRIWAT